MNWLAHAFLSKSDIEFRLGNLLADLVKGCERAATPAAFQQGMRLHQAIDAFTDYHPVVHRSRARIGEGYQHVTGILVDIFYDHFLAIDWERYASEPLDTFTSHLYANIRAYPIELPPEAKAAIDRMIRDDRLGSYRRIEGIEATLQRVSMRLMTRTGRVFELEKAVTELLDNRDGLHGDFAEYFPLLQADVAIRIEQESNQLAPEPIP